MRKIWKKGLSLVLAMILVLGMMPVTAHAAVDRNNGYPKDLEDDLVLSIYTKEGDFPGEPALHGTTDYVSFDSQFKISDEKFAESAADQLDPEKVLKENVLVQGATSSSNEFVWGIFDANGTKDYFAEGASIINETNEIKMICAVKGISEAEAKKYEIVWYIIKMQYTKGFLWFGGTAEWHIDGIIKEKEKYSVNYYGNGNTGGSAPSGRTDLTKDSAYQIAGIGEGNNMLKKVANGQNLKFLGWNTAANGSGKTYQPGDTITVTENISLYALWDTYSVHTATVNTFLNTNPTNVSEIHGFSNLALGNVQGEYYDLTNSSTGVYTTQIPGNGAFNLYKKNADNSYEKIGNYQLTVYNQNASLDIHHYSVTYDLAGSKDEFPAQHYHYGETVTAVAEVPTLDDHHRFTGWKMNADETGALIQPGAEVTASISKEITLTAQWEKTVNVTVNVTINHAVEGANASEDDGGYDQVESKDDIFLALVSRENSGAPYLETGHTLTLNEDSHAGFTFETSKERTVYKEEDYTYADMPGGTTEYTVVTSKSGYDIKTLEAVKNTTTGDWTINVELEYNPSNFDINFTVEVNQEQLQTLKDMGYVPDAAIVKVTFWSTDRQAWEIITQQKDNEQEGTKPGVRVDLDPVTGTGTGSYPVWKYESGTNNPYLYRIEVTSFVYPDGTIVRAQTVADKENMAWTDQVYTATVDESSIGGMAFGKSNGDLSDELIAKLDSKLDGAYYSDAKEKANENDKQAGTLNAVITMDLHTVTFNANGGKINGGDKQDVYNQYKIPSFKGYVPTREGGYTFAGWYLDEKCDERAEEGKDLEESIELYAKWIEPLTITGKVSILGHYYLPERPNEPVEVNGIDKAAEAIVVLQEKIGDTYYEVDSKTVTFDYEAGKDDVDDYIFSGIPNDGKQYRIQILLLNYNTMYDNENDAGQSFSNDEESAEWIAVFGDNNEAVVDAQLTFVPPSYDQDMIVDATAISESFRPTSVLAKVLYRDIGDIHPFNVISQHRDGENLGVKIDWAQETGTGEGTESIWKWHTDGALYEYQMSIVQVNGAPFDSENAYYHVEYAAPAFWDEANASYSAKMKAALIPNKYLVTFELNADGETVTGMEAYLNSTTGKHETVHTWSFDTAINATPVRTGYTFRGWEADVTGTYADGKIPANVAQNVVLKAKWEAIKSYTITTSVNNAERGETSGDGTYSHGATVTLRAVAKEGYSFEGWYDLKTGNRVTTDVEFTFTAEADKDYLARFYKNSTYKNRYAYILGYSDTVMGADGPLRRGELAGMIYRLAKQNGQLDKSETDKFIYDKDNPSFTDISGEWFQCAIEYMQYRGGISTPTGKAVNGYAQVTRGEAFKMIALGLGFATDTTLTRTQYGELLAEFGYIVGMNGSGDLDTGSLMNRAQFVTLYNRVIGRTGALLEDAQGNQITHETYGFTDLKSGEWYYEDMLRGTSAYTEDGFVSLEDRAIRNDVDDYN